jgi:hypothetical protein
MILRAAFGDVPSSIAMDHDSVKCQLRIAVSENGEYLLHLDKFEQLF